MKIGTRKIFGVVVLFLAVALVWMSRVPSGPITPTGKVAEAVGWRAVAVLSGLENPWSMAWLPTGEMLITEKTGRLRLVRDGRLLPTPVSGLTRVFTEGNTELMEVSLHPQFAEIAGFI